MTLSFLPVTPSIFEILVTLDVSVSVIFTITALYVYFYIGEFVQKPFPSNGGRPMRITLLLKSLCPFTFYDLSLSLREYMWVQYVKLGIS